MGSFVSDSLSFGLIVRTDGIGASAFTSRMFSWKDADSLRKDNAEWQGKERERERELSRFSMWLTNMFWVAQELEERQAIIRRLQGESFLLATQVGSI